MRAFKHLRSAMADPTAAAAQAGAASRVAYAPARALFRSPEQAAALRTESGPLCQDGHVVAWSGFTGVSYPKAMPLALLREMKRRASDAGPSGGAHAHLPRLSLLSGASTGTVPENAWAEAGVLAFRAPYQSATKLTQGINKGVISFTDVHLSKFTTGVMQDWYARSMPDSAMRVRYGDPDKTGRPLPRVRSDGRIDLAIVEVSAIDANGGIILGTAAGATPELLYKADNIILEVNSAIPDMTGFHDLLPANKLHGTGQPLLLTSVGQRMGSHALPIDWSRVRAVVPTAQTDDVSASPAPDDVSEHISAHLVDFFQSEVRQGRLPSTLPPLQSGIGNIANAVVAGLGSGGFQDMSVWSEVLQDAFMPLLQNGAIRQASTASLRLSHDVQKIFADNIDFFKKNIVIRQQAVSNCPELVARLGVICLNTPVEVDMYGHANSTCVLGSRMVHGLGGSGDFLRHARISVLHTPSMRASRSDPEGISCIVPMVSHVDHTEHDIDVVCTEQGLADVRGLAPRERARLIIDKCAHPSYRPLLRDYLDRAERRSPSALHEPHMLECALQMHTHLQTHDTMKVPQWNSVVVPKTA